jgi:hypothetical protein
MGLIRRRDSLVSHRTADPQPGACGVRRTGLYSRASTSLQRGSPDPHAVSAHTGDDPFCNPSREVKPFSPVAAMSGFGV